MYAKVESLGLNGLDAFSVTVEADIGTGLPRFDIVGLPDMAVRESRERVRAFRWPNSCSCACTVRAIAGRA